MPRAVRVRLCFLRDSLKLTPIVRLYGVEGAYHVFRVGKGLTVVLLAGEFAIGTVE